MAGSVPHISVCACTYKRPELLARLLHGLAQQVTHGQFTYDVLIVDNDRDHSGEDVVARFAAESRIAFRYVTECTQGIARARNAALRNADGDFVAFIDDDEIPANDWLVNLYRTCTEKAVDGVLGPVKPHFDQTPPRWVLAGKFHERSSYPTGMVIEWRMGRTGNVLLRRRVVDGDETPFNPAFRTGEDQDFFHRMIHKGFVFVWCNEAVAYEVIPPVRWKRSFMLRRALLRGAMEPKTPGFGLSSIARSAVAAVVYTAALPFALVAGQSTFMVLLIRLCDHLGKLLAVMGINPVHQEYVIE